ncbi:MAG: DNRLRE domain-containing protein [Candidatus Cloacimonadota bacterium]|nr:MAG: DNRLRE domain-containing protein [Candidatus Cloacimonadota bacterium]
MKKLLLFLIFVSIVAGCRDKLDNPVGIGEISKDIPKPVFIGDIVGDSVSNYHTNMNTGNAKRLWIGKTDSLEARVLVRFAIVDTSIINYADSAMVTFSLEGTYKKGVSIAIYPLSNIWDETTVGWNRSSTDTQWTTPGGDYEPTKIAEIVINESEKSFTFSCEDFSLLDTSRIINRGMIFIYELGDTLLSIYSRESSTDRIRITVFHGDSTTDFFPVSDAFILNSTYIKEDNEIVMVEGFVNRSLIYFDIDSIPYNVTINRAFLTFGIKPDKSYLDSVTVFIHRITGDWEEGQTEYSVAASAEFKVAKEDTLKEIDVTSLVQYWLNERENKGILLRSKNENSYCTRLVFDADQLPVLSIYYTPPPAGSN